MTRLAFATFGRLLPTIASRYAYRLWFRAPRYKLLRRELQWQEQARVSVIEHNNLPLTVYEWGEGPVVLLVHGWSGCALQLGGFGITLAQNGYHAVAMDLPAHGDTPGSHANAFSMAAAIETVLQHYGMLHGIITHSYGVIPVTLLLREGLPVSRVVCISPPDNQRFLFQRFVEYMQLPATVVKRLQREIAQVFGDNVWEVLSAERNVAQLGIPALIVHDENDAVVSIQHGEVLVRAWPGAKLHRTRGLGHRRILSDKVTIDCVCRFFKG